MLLYLECVLPYLEFHIIVCGLDSVVARRWMNGMLVRIVGSSRQLQYLHTVRSALVRVLVLQFSLVSHGQHNF